MQGDDVMGVELVDDVFLCLLLDKKNRSGERAPLSANAHSLE